MLDRNLCVLKSWSLSQLAENTSFQGIAFDGDNLWVSVAGSTDLIYQLDATTDTLNVLASFDAPPTGSGTIRDIAWDGQYLWAVNSGSETYAIPPTLYKLNPADGAIVEEFPLPGPEPRGLGYVGPNADAYGAGATSGLYVADVTLDSVYTFVPAKKTFLGAFASPIPPAGESYIFPVGLTFDGRDFWVINSSSLGDYLYQLDYTGLTLNRIELPFTTPGPLVWATKDIRAAQAPTISGVTPNTAARGSVLAVTITGNYFRPGAGLDASFGAGVTVDSVIYIGSSAVRAYVEVATDAEFGPRDVTVTNPDGQVATGTALFTILSIDPLAGYLWMTDAGTDSLFKIRISDTAIVGRWSTIGVAPGGSAQGLVYDGSAIWMSAAATDDAVMKLNTSGATLSAPKTIAAPTTGSDIIRDLAFDGEYLWACNSTAAQIYQIDTADGTKLDSIPTPGIEARGIVIVDGQLYCNDKDLDSVYMYDTGSSSWIAQFATPIPPGGTTSNRWATGMTWDGVNFWIANSTGVYDYIFQVTTTGTVLRTYAAPYRDAAQPQGLTFTQD
jgi:hypothetical protein